MGIVQPFDLGPVSDRPGGDDHRVGGFGFDQGAVGAVARIILAAFAIIHVGLHMMFARHPANEFDNTLSQVLIWGTGIASALYLAGLLLAEAAL